MTMLSKLFLLFLTIGCTAQPRPVVTPASPAAVTRTGTGFKVDASHIEAITPGRTQKIQAALQLFERVMNDSLFQADLRRVKFYFDVPNDPLRKLSDQQVVDRLYAAEEFYQKGKDSTASPHWIIKQRSKSGYGIGYADQDEVEFYTFSWVIDEGDLAGIAGIAAHEWSHKLGFQHGFGEDPRERESVTYAFGDLVKKHAKRLQD